MTLESFRTMAGLAGDGTPPRKPLCAALDIGTHKIACVIARARLRPGDGAHDVKVIGVGHHESRGVKAGVIIDLAAAESAIRGAIDAAERRAGLTVDEVIVSASCGRIRSEIYEIGVPVPTATVRQEDLDRVLQAARAQPREDARLTLHSMPLGYALDDNEGVSDPRGMYGERLSVGMHVVTAEAGPLRNLALGVDRAHVRIDRVCVSPLASALATLGPDEADLGAICIEMGAGCTTLAMFVDGMFVHADGVALGGQHVTLDIARGLSTPLADAERLKTLHGSVLAAANDEREFVDVPTVGEGEEHHRVAKSMISRIVRPRIEETFEMLRDRLAATGTFAGTDRRVVLTGGASQLTGVDEVAARILDAEVRLGSPRPFAGAPAGTGGPGFSTAAGLVAFAQTEDLVSRVALPDRSLRGGGYLTRVGRWLKESF